MLAFARLHQVERRLRNRRVLSVFIDTSATGPAGARRGGNSVFWQNGIVVGPLLSARAKSRAVALGDIGFGHVAGDLDNATGGIAATLRTRPVDSSNARTSSHATPA